MAQGNKPIRTHWFCRRPAEMLQALFSMNERIVWSPFPGVHMGGCPLASSFRSKPAPSKISRRRSLRTESGRRRRPFGRTNNRGIGLFAFGHEAVICYRDYTNIKPQSYGLAHARRGSCMRTSGNNSEHSKLLFLSGPDNPMEEDIRC